MPNLEDLWDSCYTAEYRRQIPPKQFSEDYCSRCSNVMCHRSKINNTDWRSRMEEQVDRLLLHPRFGDEHDPRFRGLHEMQFDNIIQKAMKLEIAAQRGDWEVVSDAEAAKFAQDLGDGDAISDGPVHFEDNMDDIENALAEAEAALSDEAEDEEPAEQVEPEPEEDEVEPIWHVQIGKARYDVRLWEEGWTCTCKAFQFGRANPCKHIVEAQALYERQEATKKPEPPAPPTRSQEPSQARPRRRVDPHLGGNTNFPSEGIMIDGSAPPPPPQARPQGGGDDPWAPQKKRRDNVIQPGTKIILGKKDD